MRNPLEVLKEKEANMAQVKSEIAALKLAIPLLVEESDIKADREEKPKEAQP